MVSALHLRHPRRELDAAVAQATGRQLIGWLDAPVDRRTGLPAKEWRGINFLPADPALEAAWSAFWPTGRGVHSRDAVARLEGDGQAEWLLVEAKAHLEELITHCGTRPHGGLLKIREAFRLTKVAVGANESSDWEKLHYQYVNRLAFLYFPTGRGISARLLFIYLVGDTFEGRACPKTEEEWGPAFRP